MVFVISSFALFLPVFLWLCVLRLITIHLIFIIDKQAAAHNITLHNVTFTEMRWVCVGLRAKQQQQWMKENNGYNVKDIRARTSVVLAEAIFSIKNKIQKKTHNT